MPGTTLLALALGVSADAFAVALGKGLAMPRFELRAAVALAATFGGFQALMPLLGDLAGRDALGHLGGWGHLLAAGLLVLVGGKLLQPGPADPAATARTSWWALLALGLATSVDAFAVGVSLGAVQVAVVPAVLVIGATTLLVSLAGVVIGHRLGQGLRRPAEVLGGLVLLGVAAKVLLQAAG